MPETKYKRVLLKLSGEAFGGEAKFGIDTSSYIGELYYKQITTTPTKYSALQRTAEILAEQKGTTPEEEFEKLIQSPLEEGEVLEQAVDVPKLQEQKADIEKQIAEAKKKLKEAGKEPKKPVTPTAPTKTFGPEVRFPTTQAEMEEWREKNVYDPESDKWYQKPKGEVATKKKVVKKPAKKPAPEIKGKIEEVGKEVKEIAKKVKKVKKEPETPKLGAPIAGFPTTQLEYAQWKEKYLYDKGTKKWYQKP